MLGGQVSLDAFKLGMYINNFKIMWIQDVNFDYGEGGVMPVDHLNAQPPHPSNIQPSMDHYLCNSFVVPTKHDTHQYSCNV